VRDLPAELAQRADVVIVNDVEYRLGRWSGACPEARSCGPKQRREPSFTHGDRQVAATPSSVEAIEAIEAGDSFAGAFTVALLDGQAVTKALPFARAPGALATTPRGAQLPWQAATR
jgi:ribokinase